MSMSVLLPLLLQYGLPAVTSIVQLIESGQNVTAAQLQAILAQAQQNAQARVLTVLQQQGIDPKSPTGVAILALAA